MIFGFNFVARAAIDFFAMETICCAIRPDVSGSLVIVRIEEGSMPAAMRSSPGRRRTPSPTTNLSPRSDVGSPTVPVGSGSEGRGRSSVVHGASDLRRERPRAPPSAS